MICFRKSSHGTLVETCSYYPESCDGNPARLRIRTRQLTVLSMIGPNRAATFNRVRGRGCMVNGRKELRSSEMNVKSIAGQLGERPDRVALSSDSARPPADRWSVSDFVALTKPRVMM